MSLIDTEKERASPKEKEPGRAWPEDGTREKQNRANQHPPEGRWTSWAPWGHPAPAGFKTISPRGWLAILAFRHEMLQEDRWGGGRNRNADSLYPGPLSICRPNNTFWTCKLYKKAWKGKGEKKEQPGTKLQLPSGEPLCGLDSIFSGSDGLL